MNNSNFVTRLAPSPTGALHLGNARTFLLNWVYARQIGAEIILRIDDIDSPRVKPNAVGLTFDDLKWLGLDWDEGPYFQTQRLEHYRAAIRKLMDVGLAYPCVCSRKDVETAASAPHGDSGVTVYPGTCRGRFKTYEDAVPHAKHGNRPAIRFCTDSFYGDSGGKKEVSRKIEFTDLFAGFKSFDCESLGGDFVIARSMDAPAYQLASVVDDEMMNVTLVWRGDDLLPSAAMQLSLIEALGYRKPQYIHTPLLVGEDGRRLAKRHGDTRLATYRENGVKPDAIIGWLAKISGMNPNGEPRTAAELVGKLNLKNIPLSPIVVTSDDSVFSTG